MLSRPYPACPYPCIRGAVSECRCATTSGLYIGALCHRVVQRLACLHDPHDCGVDLVLPVLEDALGRLHKTFCRSFRTLFTDIRWGMAPRHHWNTVAETVKMSSGTSALSTRARHAIGDANMESLRDPIWYCRSWKVRSVVWTMHRELTTVTRKLRQLSGSYLAATKFKTVTWKLLAYDSYLLVTEITEVTWTFSSSVSFSWIELTLMRKSWCVNAESNSNVSASSTSLPFGRFLSSRILATDSDCSVRFSSFGSIRLASSISLYLFAVD